MTDSYDLGFTPVDDLDQHRLDALADVLGRARGTHPGYLLDEAIIRLRDHGKLVGIVGGLVALCGEIDRVTS